ncbi:MAG: hypothetical protein A4E66_00475 [Syntrophus sp. PtaB.Bin001]|nr:MAG: hypothetical protein A4E66_00475 [Syntrophus sp. PtaB.Bin001]
MKESRKELMKRIQDHDLEDYELRHPPSVKETLNQLFKKKLESEYYKHHTIPDDEDETIEGYVARDFYKQLDDYRKEFFAKHKDQLSKKDNKWPTKWMHGNKIKPVIQKYMVCEILNSLDRYLKESRDNKVIKSDYKNKKQDDKFLATFVVDENFYKRVLEILNTILIENHPIHPKKIAKITLQRYIKEFVRVGI